MNDFKLEELRSCCSGLDSPRITERKRSIDKLRCLLSDNLIVGILNSDDAAVRWETILHNVEQYLIRESMKMNEDEQKRKSLLSDNRLKAQSSGMVLSEIIAKANADGVHISGTKLVTFIFQGFNSVTLRKYFARQYADVLVNRVLPVKKYWYEIESVRWIDIFSLLKELYTNQVLDVLKSTIVQGMYLIVKHSDLHCSLSYYLRNEFDFITIVCKDLQMNTKLNHQVAGIKLAQTLCKKLGKDCRLASCKLGEEVFNNIIVLYQQRYEDYGGLKSLIFDFMLIQMRLHHPKGALEGSRSAYAYDWDRWRQQLTSLYSMICKEIDLKIRHKSITSEAGRQKLWPNFLQLSVEVIHQIFHTNNESTNENGYDLDSEPLPKKRKTEYDISSIIQLIKNQSTWSWMNVFKELLNVYSDTLKTGDYMNLLHVLSNLQVECKDTNTRYHLYGLLSSMVQNQQFIPEEFMDTILVESLWTKIWESTLRVIGLNQNDETTHELLQSLLYYKKASQPSSLFNIYISDVLNLNIYNIETLKILLQMFTYSEQVINGNETISTRKYLIKWILDTNNLNKNISLVYTSKSTAEILIGLVLKTWPYENDIKRNVSAREAEDIEDCYITTSFDSTIVDENTDVKKENNKKYLIHSEAIIQLTESLRSLFEFLYTNDRSNVKDTNNLISCIHLLLNTTSEMFDYNIITEENVMVNFERLFKHLEDKITEIVNRNNKDLLNVLPNIEKLFQLKLNTKLSILFRSKIDTRFLQILFDIVNNEEPDRTSNSSDDDASNQSLVNEFENSIFKTKKSKLHEKLSLISMSILVNFSWFPDIELYNQLQEYTIDTLTENTDFNPLNLHEFEVTIYMLKAMNKRKSDAPLADALNQYTLDSLTKFFIAWQNDRKIMIILLNILKDSLIHFNSSNSIQIKHNILDILESLFDKREDFGIDVYLLLVECLGHLAMIDPDGSWSETRNKDVTFNLIECLKSNFHDVRLTAIRNIIPIFKQDNSVSLTKQNDMLRESFYKVFESFKVDNVVTEDRLVDETLNRTASSLHYYTGVIITSPMFKKRAFFGMMQLVKEKELNHKLVSDVVSIIRKFFKMENKREFFDVYMGYVVSHWIKTGYELKELPFKLFGCETSSEFFNRYISTVVPVMLYSDNTELLKTICDTSKKTLNEIVEETYPILVAKFLPVFVYLQNPSGIKLSGAEISNGEKLDRKLKELFTEEQLKELMIQKLDVIYIEFLKQFHDTEHFRDQFEFYKNLPEPDPPHFNHNVFVTSLKYLESLLPNGLSVISYCIKNGHRKLINILLEVTMNLRKVPTLEEKLKSLHQYSILVDYVTPELQTNNNMRIFFIRSISYTLMNLIRENASSNPSMSIAACRYYKKFIEKCLPYCNNLLEKFLTLIVSTLVPIAKSNLPPGEECIVLLNFLIVENSKLLYNTIGKLDPFPPDEKFNQIQIVYERIKYGNDKFTLEQEIEHFLNAGNLMDVGCRLEGLIHLKSQLSSKKTELIDIYKKINDLRGFSEDSEDSILHNLICMLVKLTTSSDTKISLEAARCLGELGPADLTTMVLKPEKKIYDHGKTPFELIAGQSITLLSTYIVDNDTKTMKLAVNAMITILSSKEGKLVIKSKSLDYGLGSVPLEYIAPFLTLPLVKPDVKLSINEELFKQLIDNSELWSPTTPMVHSEWITEIICSILRTFTKQSFLAALIPICKVKTEFTEMLFPLLTYLFFYFAKDVCTSVISRQFKNFFSNHWKNNLNQLSQSSTSDIITQNRASVECMLKVIHFVRQQQNLNEHRRIVEMDLNYLHVAQAAQFCSAHFTSILYAELWCYNKLDDKMISSQNGLSSLDRICVNEEEITMKALQNILRESYRKVGDIDAIYGCGTSYLLDTKSRIEHYKITGQWDKVILHHDHELSKDKPDTFHDLQIALKNSGLHYLVSNIKSENFGIMYESVWKLSNWDIHVPISETMNDEYEKYHYLALKSFHETDTIILNRSIAEARKSVIQSLYHASLESSKNLYKPLMQLQMLQEIENFVEAQNDLNLTDLLEKLKRCDQINRNEFVYVEPILQQRIVILKDIVMKTDDNNLRTFLANLYLHLADEARIENFPHISQLALDNLSSIKKLDSDIKTRKMLQEAQLLWIDNKSMGKDLLRHVLDNVKNQELNIEAHKLYGNWMVETRSENSVYIIEKYFIKALKFLDECECNGENNRNKHEISEALARFADSEYQQIVTYMESLIFLNKVQNIEKFKTMASNIIKSGVERTKDVKTAIALYDKQSIIDETEVNNTEKERDMYLNLAVRYYLLLLEESDKYDLKVFRVLSLCLKNKDNDNVIKTLKNSLSNIPSYKFISILPQLVPHLKSEKLDLFDEQIYRIIERCMLDHPHHTLPILLALAESYKDREFYSGSTQSESSEDRVVAARGLIAKYKKNKKIGQIIKNMEIISTALISLAYLDLDNCTSTGRDKMYGIPKREKITSIKNVNNVLLPTYNLELRKSCDYSNIVGIYEWNNNFQVVGGINLPKKITCVGTDGRKYEQLVKGKDDIRLDAVMQQVFGIMNVLLAKNKQTNKLLIRMYKITPLSQRSGILEWCTNTEQLSVYLTKAHKKYHPNDWTAEQCRKLLQKVANAKTNNVKLETYQNICNNFRPVFHKFFVSTFPQPTVWFERRRAYVHSVATTSMVGYILGIGDRHVANILIDKTTAEVVHIDFGIAFEQGKCLPTPETVPFRLTRDIEAGMGVSGIEGVFRRSCEKTMLVLRQNEETIVTILEVLLYDPLYAWSITAAEAYSRQKDDDSENVLKFSEETSNTNITAERVLGRLKQKLQGTENGGVSSVEGQVEQLIQQARDPVNLSRLYNGWQAYL